MAAMDALTNASLHSFGVFAQHLNFTRAAEELHIAQPSLHAKINKLGEALGVPLYVRQGRSLRLTPQGEALRRFAREAALRADDFVNELSERPTRVTVFAGRGMLRWILSERLRDAVASDLTVEVNEASGRDALAALDDGLADVAGVAADPPPRQLSSFEVARVAQVALMPIDHELAKAQEITMADLADEPLIVPPPTRPHRQQLERALAASNSRLRVSVEVEGWELMAHMTSLGLGLAVVNDLSSPPEGLTSVPVSDLPSVGYWLAWRPERPEPAALLLGASQ